MNKPETTEAAPDAPDTATNPDTAPKKPGQVLTIANIGPALTVFAIYVEEVRHALGRPDGSSSIVRDTVFHYYVDDVLVTREVYMDCMETAYVATVCTSA